MLEVLFQDEHICVINKPSGFVVHKTRGSGSFPIVLQTLRDQLGKKIYPVHRLDRGTSGGLSFAFSSEDAKKLQAELQSANCQKKYTTLCWGQTPAAGTIDRELNNENKVKQTALTKYKLLKSYKECSLLEVEIFTGRKHQIRRHLSHEKHHIIGDVNHGKGWLNRRFRENYNFHRLFLHSHHLSLRHPITHHRMSFDIPLPMDLTKLLDALKNEQNKI